MASKIFSELCSVKDRRGRDVFNYPWLSGECSISTKGFQRESPRNIGNPALWNNLVLVLFREKATRFVHCSGLSVWRRRVPSVSVCRVCSLVILAYCQNDNHPLAIKISSPTMHWVPSDSDTLQEARYFLCRLFLCTATATLSFMRWYTQNKFKIISIIFDFYLTIWRVEWRQIEKSQLLCLNNLCASSILHGNACKSRLGDYHFNSILHMFLVALSCTAPNLPKTAKAFSPKKMEISVIIIDTNLLLRSLVLADLEVRADKETAALSRNYYLKMLVI